MLKFLFSRPIAIIVSFIALSILGVVSYFQLPYSLLPQVDIPSITVQVSNSNIHYENLKKQVIEPLQKEFNTVQKLRDLNVRVTDERTVFSLFFEPNAEMDLAFIEVNEKVDVAMNALPQHLPRPLVIKKTVNDLPLLYWDIIVKKEHKSEFSHSNLSRIAEDLIKRRLEQLPEISMVDISGLSYEYVDIYPNYTLLKQLGLPTETIYNLLSKEELIVRPIRVEDAHSEFLVRIESRPMDLDRLKGIEFWHNSRLLKFSDIGEIQIKESTSDGLYFNKDERAISLALIKTNQVPIRNLRNSLQEIKKEISLLHPEIEIIESQNQIHLLEYSIQNLKVDLAFGGLLSILLVGFYLKRVNTALLIAISIPTTILISLLGFVSVGLSINIISLGGLILGLSMIIDNSIVILDSINRNLNRDKINAAYKGTKEVITPMFTSIITNIVVFVPLIFLSGLSGTLFFDQAISVVLGVTVSLIVSVFLLPILFILINKNPSKRINKTSNPLNKIYKDTLKWVFRNPYKTYGVLLILMGLGIAIFYSLDRNRLPKFSNHDLEVHIDWNETISLHENWQRTQALINILDSNYKIHSWIGIQQFLIPNFQINQNNESIIYLDFRDNEMFEAIKNQMSSFVRQNFPFTRLNFQNARNPFNQVFDDNSPELQIQVKLPKEVPYNYSVLGKFRNELEKENAPLKLASIGVKDVLSINLDYVKASWQGISPRDLSRTIENSINDEAIPSNFFQSFTMPMQIRADTTPLFKKTKTLYVKKDPMIQYPIFDFIQVETQQKLKEHYFGRYEAYYPFTVENKLSDKEIEKLQNSLENHSSISASLTGKYFENKKLLEEMMNIFVVSIMLLYCILAAQFESFVQPLFILIELPFALIGSLIFIHFGGSDLNIMSLIGIVVMTGLIINDSILKLDAINRYRKKGVTLLKAILLGSERRLNSVVLISVTSFGALLPTLFMEDMGSELQKPLVLALLGGLFLGLLFSLFIVPLIYWKYYKGK